MSTARAGSTPEAGDGASYRATPTGTGHAERPAPVPSGALPADERDESRPTVSHERVWSGPIFTVDADVVQLDAWQDAVARQVVAHHDAVAVVALREGEDSGQPDSAAEIIMVRQYRHPVRAALWEVPAGLADVAGEEPVDAAARELGEETDLRATTWRTLAEFYGSPGFTTEGVRVFLATGLSELAPEERTEREAEEAEFVPTWVRLDDAVAAVLVGRLHNPATVIGVLAADRARRDGWDHLRAADAPWLRSPCSLVGWEHRP